MVLKCLLICAVFAVIHCVTGYIPYRILLSVYYESRCPDSRDFVLNQLKPAMDLLPDYINLRLVPFGKAKSINGGYDGFECQHGPSECLGNVLQNCALDLMEGRSHAEKTDYVVCEMKTLAASNGDLSCVQKANISPDAVNLCIFTGRGTQLQLDSEFLTKLINPQFVPTVTFDGIFNQQIQDHSQIDLIGTICSILKETKQCAHHYNSMAFKQIL